jgi:hypothetical protein
MSANATSTTSTTNKNVSNMTNAELNNMIKKLSNESKNNTPTASKNITPANTTITPISPPANTKTSNLPKKNETKNEKKNENNNNNNNDNNDNNNNNNNKNKNKSEEPNILEKGMNSIGDIFGDIKDKISGSNENKNKINKNNKNELKNEPKNEIINETKNNTKKNIISAPEPEGESIWYIVVKIIIMVIVLVIIYYVVKYLFNKYQFASTQTPYLLNGSKNAKNALVISQDSSNVNYIPINLSDGQDGIQFTYGFWLLISDFTYKKGEWKHIFHKGNSSSYPNRAPGVWIKPDTNGIRVYMNTLDNILEYADIDNLPVKKWIYMNVVLNNKNLDLYVNGYLKIRKELSSLPKQNNDDFWVNMYGGFEGYVSNIRYYSFAIDFNEINAMIKAGPSINNCIDTGEIPPYLDDDWWFSYE